VFSLALSRRVGQLLTGIRMVREGEYTQRISLAGHDELAQLAQELNLLTGRLQTTEAERRRFVSDASHELKTPLASIKLLTDSILQDEHIDQDTTREFVADIGQAADRLICVSQDLLELNRLDEGRKVRREPVDLSQQAEYTAKLLAPLAESAGVTIHLHGDQGCMALCGKEDAVQILRNLMENAIKYNNPGGKVDVTTSREGETVGLEVADTGVGIPEEDMPRIFERFYRVDKARSRQAGGTGLGLSIVKDTVLLHGGEIRVEPRETGGTRFLVRLPAWDGEEGEA
jgi:signal transduction histidine kinase